MAYLRVLCSNWITFVSAVITITAVAVGLSGRNLLIGQRTWFCIAFGGFLVCSIRLWYLEHRTAKFVASTFERMQERCDYIVSAVQNLNQEHGPVNNPLNPMWRMQRQDGSFCYVSRELYALWVVLSHLGDDVARCVLDTGARIRFIDMADVQVLLPDYVDMVKETKTDIKNVASHFSR